MSNATEIKPIEHVALTVLVDNKANLLVESNDQIQYFTDEPLLAEHGFSVLIRLDDSESQILWDAGVSKVALLENMKRMKIDPTHITKIALSHGHLDHYAALTALLSEMDILPEEKEWQENVTADDIEAWIEMHQIPIVAHPAAFRERWWKKDDGTMVGPFLPPPYQEWQAAGAKIITSEEPYELGPGCWTTSYIPRDSFEESGRPSQLLFREGSDFAYDDMDDDQAIGIYLQGKGLIVLSGCAHSGIVNTVNQVKRIFGIETIHAIVGGFHLAEASDEEIDQTIDLIKGFAPKLVFPSHCTGFRATNQFAQEMPDEFAEGVVGATYLF
jgi:7,8-dihydropterin-6-yl-methyl-4-(beta-D-ribofuranosyl)aminobenzene 5'-phosphate synthase